MKMKNILIQIMCILSCERLLSSSADVSGINAGK
jgi:hypothetical protein